MITRMPLRNWTVLAAVALCASLGEALLKHGMAQVGALSWANWTAALTAFLNPWVVAGVLLLIVFFAAYVTALSFADLTYVLPATAVGYLITTLIARFALGEYVSPYRWAGVVLISVGVGLVARGPFFTEKIAAAALARASTGGER